MALGRVRSCSSRCVKCGRPFWTNCAVAGPASSDAFETRTYQEYMQVITQSIGEQEGYVRDLVSTCEAQKLHLVGTSRDRQALDSVRDRHKQAHGLTVQRHEQGVMDELATSRFNFGQRTQEG